ncbi:hypothetical protein GH714_005086 [Hevea brasiliensis]|uniref:Retrotransposon gag domain-containing protein n=1 Tax=Hevea brasiliensis TaxID=3981 RepID=A0A6A6LE33_HEVBR|nr:hypothetical protein GH714_005086 [Hevea brasiliensis]
MCKQNTENMGNKDRGSVGTSPKGVSVNQNLYGSYIKLGFPRFNVDGLEGWLLLSEYFFEVGKIAPENCVKVATLHLEGRAIQWHQGFVKVKGNEAYVSGEEFTDGFMMYNGNYKSNSLQLHVAQDEKEK